MYSKVIVPLDGSELAERALLYAQLLAGPLSAPIELVEAYDVFPPAMYNQGAMFALHEMLEQAEQRSQGYLEGVRERLRATGFVATVATLVGTPERAIVERAGADPDALVVMSTHGRGGIARWALGSVADKVLHTIPNPVLIIHAGVAAPDVAVNRVLAPLDGSDLAELCLPHAAGLAAALGTAVELLRVEPTTEYYRRHFIAPLRPPGGSSHVPERLADDFAQAEHDEVDEYLERVRRRLAVAHPDATRVSARQLRNDNVAQAIIDAAGAEPSLVVMTTHGHSGFRRMVLGSVTDRVIRHSNVPVLVIRQWDEPAYTGLTAPVSQPQPA